MQDSDEQSVSVRAKCYLIDPASMSVIWMNEAASRGLTALGEDVNGPLPVKSVVPMAEAMAVPAAVSEVAETGEARHLRTDLVSTAKGSVLIVTSLYRLPDGLVLGITENSWTAQERTERAGGRRSGRTRR